MAERKPPGVSWHSWIEQTIETARREGQFEDLPGKGKPIAGLNSPYDPDWWPKQLIQREKLSLLPPALAIRARVQQEIPRILKLRRERDVRVALGKLNDEIAKVNRTVWEGPATAIGKIDEQSFLERWREGRGESSES